MGRDTLRPSIDRFAWLLALTVVSLLASSEPVEAQCAPNMMMATTIDCDGADPDGYNAGATDDLTLNVLNGATVTNGANPDTIVLNNGSTVTVQSGGEVTIDAAGGRAIVVGDGANDNTVRIENGATLNLNAANTVGVDAGNGDAAMMQESTLRNLGMITSTQAGAIGLRVGDTDNVVANDTDATGSGSIQLSGDDSRGIVGGNDNALVVNNGDLTLDGANSIGVLAGNANAAVGNDRSGTITISAPGGVGVRMGDDNVNGGNFGEISITGGTGVGIDAGDGNTFVNSPAPSTPPDGIFVSGNGGIGVRMLDSNTFTNSGPLEATGTGGVGVIAGSAGGTGNTIINSGTIRGDAVGVAFSGADAGATDNVLTNNAAGTIEGVSGPAVLGSAGIETVTHGGTITGNVLLLGGNDQFMLQTGATTTGMIDGGAGTDALELGAGIGEGSFDLSTATGFETLTVSSGTWALSNTGTFSGGSTFETGSVVAVRGPVTVNGDVTLDDGSTLDIALDPLGTSGVFDTSGTLNIGSGARLRLSPANPLASGSVFPLVRAGTLIGSFGVDGLPANTAVLDFDLVSLMPNELSLQVTRNPYASAATTPNASAVAQALDAALASAPTGSLGNLLAQLDMLGIAAFGDALASFSPEAYDAHTSANLWMARAVADVVSGREPRCEPVTLQASPPEIASSPCAESAWEPWVAAVGSLGNRDGDRGHIDYDHAGGGIALGVDRRLGPWVVSGYLGGTFGTLEVDDVGDGEFSSLELGVAARLAIANGHVRGVVGYGHGFHDQDRDIRVGNLVSTASGDFDSDRVLARLEGGAAFPLMAGLDIEPIGSVEYTWLREDRVTESGGGAAALRVDARSHGVLATTAGVRLSTQLTRFAYLGRYLEWSVGVWRAELDARWHSTWQDADRDIEAQLAAAPGAAPFEVEAEDGDQGVLVQLGTTFQPYRSGVLVGLRYRGYLANGRQVHSGLLQLEVPL